MKTRVFLLCALGMLAGTVFAEDAPNAAIETVPRGDGNPPPALTLASSADEVLHACRAMLPARPVELTGSLIVRSRKGIVASEHDYRLIMRREPACAMLTVHLSPRGSTNETASVTVTRKTGSRPVIRLTRAGAAEAEIVESPLATVLDTDVTWLDLTFDYLWWSSAAYEREREGESVHGQKCSVILARPDTPVEGLSGMRIWVDKKTGCLMQTEQVGADGKPLRRLWGTRVKRFDGKWMVSVLEVEKTGSRRRTKIMVDGIREL